MKVMCSFCDKFDPKHAFRGLHGMYICDECVLQAAEMLDGPRRGEQEYQSWYRPTTTSERKP